MTQILLLGSTGRTGIATLRALPPDMHVTAALRTGADAGRLPAHLTRRSRLVVDITDPESLRRATAGVDVVINAIRLRDDIPETALIDLHERLAIASRDVPGARPRIVTVGGAGALRLPGGSRLWQHPAFPTVTVPRGRAHAALRVHLERDQAGGDWAYLVPPSDYQPDGPATGRHATWPPSSDEREFARRSISYADFGIAVVDAVREGATGTRLVAWPGAAGGT